MRTLNVKTRQKIAFLTAVDRSYRLIPWGTPLYGLYGFGLSVLNIACLRRNKKQTAVINIRKYKRISGKKKGFILTFRMFQHTSFFLLKLRWPKNKSICDLACLIRRRCLSRTLFVTIPTQDQRFRPQRHPYAQTWRLIERLVWPKIVQY